MGLTYLPHHVITAPNNEQKHLGRSSVLELHDLARWPGLPPDGRPPHLRHLGLGWSMMMIILTCVGAAAVEHASSNAVAPNEASRRRAARLRLFRARTPRAVSLDGVRNVSLPSRAAADVVEATEFFRQRAGFSQVGRVVV